MESDAMEREAMEFDVVIVGAGPAGLSAACRLMQLAKTQDPEQQTELSVCVVEKGSEVGAHILSGAILEPRALDELFPDWKECGAPLNAPIVEDEIHWCSNASSSLSIPHWLSPRSMHNDGNYIISLGNLCRWLAEQAESLGVEIFPGFAAAKILYHADGSVKGIATGDMGVGRDGTQKDGYMPGMELHAKFTLFAEGCRGHLGKELLAKFALDANSDPQHYGIGIKELWDISPEKHQPGQVIHAAGWPLKGNSHGGAFLYHIENNQVSVGLIVDLDYDNPQLSPFDEFQQMKHHPLFAQCLEGGNRVSFGARAIAKGGINSLPKMSFPGGLLIGCNAGTLNFAKIKGIHTAMKSGMIAAQVLVNRLTETNDGTDTRAENQCGYDLVEFDQAFKSSWAYDELYRARNFGPAIHRFGTLLGGAFNTVDQNLFGGKLPFTLHDTQPDYTKLKAASAFPPISYPKPDGVLSFDKPSSVYLSNTNHEEDQPCHLQLKNVDIPITHNLPLYNEPAQHYCPAGVYEIVEDEAGKFRLQINAQNCLHCKTCDIKDPSQNITWVTPEGSGGPNYPNM